MFVIVKMSYTDWTVFNAESGSTDTSEVVTGLSLGSKYVFDISAVNDSGSGSTVETGQISLTPQSVPSSASFPTNFSAQSYQDSKSTLTWTHSANTSTEGVYGYKIEYKQNYTGTYQTATENTGLVTTYEVTGLTNTGAYFFKISPVNEAGVSTSGVESSTTTFTGAQATGVGDTSYNVVSGGKSYKVHKFTQAGSLTIQGNLENPEILIVAGGGGGGMDIGGGGGGGGVIAGSVSSLLAGTYNVIVGLGGDGAPKPESGSTEKRQRSDHPFSYPAKNGQNSSFGDFVALGGGGGGTTYEQCAIAIPSYGGSGGGATGYNSNGGNNGRTGGKSFARYHQTGSWSELNYGGFEGEPFASGESDNFHYTGGGSSGTNTNGSGEAEFVDYPKGWTSRRSSASNSATIYTIGRNDNNWSHILCQEWQCISLWRTGASIEQTLSVTQGNKYRVYLFAGDSGSHDPANSTKIYADDLEILNITSLVNDRLTPFFTSDFTAGSNAPVLKIVNEHNNANTNSNVIIDNVVLMERPFEVDSATATKYYNNDSAAYPNLKVYGNAGGTSNHHHIGSGGGGAGAVGASASNSTIGHGGDGIQIDWVTPEMLGYSGSHNSVTNTTPFYWAGGGGGSSHDSNGSGTGGKGGGGGGGSYDSSPAPGVGDTGTALNDGETGFRRDTGTRRGGGNAGANTGGGGGGGPHKNSTQDISGGNGGSGIVLIRYETPGDVPDAPGLVVVTNGYNKLGVVATAPTNNGGSAVLEYLLKYKKDTDTNWISETLTTSTTSKLIDLTSADNGVLYNVSLQAINNLGPSAAATKNITIGVASSITTSGGAAGAVTNIYGDSNLIKYKTYKFSYSSSHIGPDNTKNQTNYTMTVGNNPITLDFLIVAGGGGGGMDVGGGGGGGGVIKGQTTFSVGSHDVKVGAGGWGAPAGATNGTRIDGTTYSQYHQHHFNESAHNGKDSVLGAYTAKGGGYASSSRVQYDPDQGIPGNGGSGGGSSGYEANSTDKARDGGIAIDQNGNTITSGSTTLATGVVSYGWKGGGAYHSHYSGGGGGAGGPGKETTADEATSGVTNVPHGGDGIQIDWVTPQALGYSGDPNGVPNATPFYWGGGGGGSVKTNGSPGGTGGKGGGGGGAFESPAGGTGGINDGFPGGSGYNDSPGGNGGADTGGGGGGGSHYDRTNQGGDGGSGIIIVRHPVILSKPDAPTFEIKSSTVSSVTLEWSPPNDGGSTITAYEAGWRTFDNSSWTDNSDATSPQTISGLTADTPYYFRLKATNTIGSSEYSTTEYVTVPKTFYVVSTGDVVTSYEDSNNIFYKVHTFNSSSTFTVTGTVTADIFLVGGGGGGGYLGGGGGGGGGVVYKLNEVLGTSSSSKTYTVTIGTGGTGSSSATSHGGKGNNTSLVESTSNYSEIARGGAGGTSGAYSVSNSETVAIGSGGGGSSDTNLQNSRGTSFQGATYWDGSKLVNAGYTGSNGIAGTSSGGGGGAGGAADYQTDGSHNGSAGKGVDNVWLGNNAGANAGNASTGVRNYAGGGGGGKKEGTTASDIGAAGGGGTVVVSSTNPSSGGGGYGYSTFNNTTWNLQGASGRNNSGGGGGGGGRDYSGVVNGGSGGDGIVAIRYKIKKGAPYPPTNVQVFPAQSTSFNVSWDAPTYNGGYAITGYKVEYSTDNFANYSVKPDTQAAQQTNNVTTMEITGLSSTTTYQFRVVSFNNDGTNYVSSVSSEIVSGHTTGQSITGYTGQSGTGSLMTVQTYSSYKVYAFTTSGVSGSGSFVVSGGPINVDFMIVGGGGAGGTAAGGGGGGGGVVIGTNAALPNGTYNVVVGDGGNGVDTTGLSVGDSTSSITLQKGGNGGYSSIIHNSNATHKYVALGGGGGGAGPDGATDNGVQRNVGSNGGSGGGSSPKDTHSAGESKIYMSGDETGTPTTTNIISNGYEVEVGGNRVDGHRSDNSKPYKGSGSSEGTITASSTNAFSGTSPVTKLLDDGNDQVVDCIWASNQGFDSTTGNYNGSDSSGGEWIKFQYPTGAPDTRKKITGYQILPSRISTGREISTKINVCVDWTFQGSNDDASWTTLDTQTDVKDGWFREKYRYFFFKNTTAYTYYRILITKIGHIGGDTVDGVELAGVSDPDTTTDFDSQSWQGYGGAYTTYGTYNTSTQTWAPKTETNHLTSVTMSAFRLLSNNVTDTYYKNDSTTYPNVKVYGNPGAFVDKFHGHWANNVQGGGGGGAGSRPVNSKESGYYMGECMGGAGIINNFRTGNDQYYAGGGGAATFRGYSRSVVFGGAGMGWNTRADGTTDDFKFQETGFQTKNGPDYQFFGAGCGSVYNYGEHNHSNADAYRNAYQGHYEVASSGSNSSGPPNVAYHHDERPTPSQPGRDNTGGGGGGGGSAYHEYPINVYVNSLEGSDGGSGIVVIRYKYMPMVPGIPTSFTVIPGNTQATLSWNAPSDNGGSDITSYIIQQKTEVAAGHNFYGDWVSLPSVSTTSPSPITSLVNGTKYKFRVYAVNGVGNGSPTAESEAVKPDLFSAYSSGGNAASRPVTTYTSGGKNYKVHTFLYDASASNTSTDVTTYTFTTSSFAKSMDFLIVAAGGEGGKRRGGGGGGGGVVWGTGWTVPVGTHTVKIGNGVHGSGGVVPTKNGSTRASWWPWIGMNGKNSGFEFTNSGTKFIALGGGGGASWETAYPFGGGSAGGSSHGQGGAPYASLGYDGEEEHDSSGTSVTDYTGMHHVDSASASNNKYYRNDAATYYISSSQNVKVYGNDGGKKDDTYSSGPGGGAGAPGNIVHNTTDSYVGADGIYCPLRYGPAGSTNHSVTPPSGWDNSSSTDFPQYYAAGGSGRDNGGIVGNPKGGGGRSTQGNGSSGSIAATSGTPHTGGGGGGGSQLDDGAEWSLPGDAAIGGSGIVVIRYEV